MSTPLDTPVLADPSNPVEAYGYGFAIGFNAALGEVLGAQA